MGNWRLSLVSLYGSYLRRSFSLAGLSSHTIKIDDATTLHVWASSRPTMDQAEKNSQKKKKPSLVLIHGFGPPSTWQWGPQVAALSLDFDLYVPDLVFFGDTSTTSSSSERSEVFQAECVAKMMEKLVGPAERYYVVGTSYGGFVAYHMARMWPERVEKVVLSSSAVNMTRLDNEGLMMRAEEEGLKEKGSSAAAHHEKKKIEDVMLPQTPSQLRILMRLVFHRRQTSSFLLPDFLLNDFIHNLYEKNADKKSELLGELTLGRDDHHAFISPLQQEVLIVWGEHDQIFLLEKAFQLKDLLGKKARLEVIEKTSHLPHIEKPRCFNDILRGFLCGSDSRG